MKMFSPTLPSSPTPDNIGNKYISALQNIASVSLFKGTYYKQAFRVEEMFDSH